MHSAGVTPEHDLFIQLMKLKNTLRRLMGEDLVTHVDEKNEESLQVEDILYL